MYSGWHKEQFVAVKLLCNESEKLTKEEYKEFISEGKMMLCVTPLIVLIPHSELTHHDHVIKIHAISVSEENPAIIMEHADKGTLKNFLQQLDRQLSKEMIFNLVVGMAKGIKSLHKQDIVHRDLAARNVLVSTTATKLVSPSLLADSRYDA